MCYYKFDSSHSKYGIFFNYYGLTSPHNLAPQGWRVSTFFDYPSLISSLEPLYTSEAMKAGIESMAGGYLKSKKEKIWGNEGCSELDSKFDALPSRGYSTNINYTDYDSEEIEEFAEFWCLTDWKAIVQLVLELSSEK